MSTARPTARRPRLTGLALSALALPLLLASCQSGPSTKIDPEKQLDLYRLTARYHYDLGDLNAAEKQALRGLELDDEDRSLRLMLGWILLRRGDVASLERAAWVFEEYIDDNGGESRAWLGLAAAHERLGVAYQTLGEEISRGDRLPDRGSPAKRSAELEEWARESWLEARRLYGETLSEQSGSLRALDGEQRIAARLGDYDEALEWSSKLLETAGAERDWYQRALRERDLDARDEIRMRDSERGVRRLMIDTHLVASSIHVARGALSEALTHLDDALELDPDYIEGYSRRAQLNYELGKFEAAESDIRHFIGRTTLPTDAPDMQAAFAILEHASRRDPSLEFESGLTDALPEAPLLEG